jgi:hypothetical protein
MALCKNCGTENAGNVRYCSFCNAPIEKEDTPSSAKHSDGMVNQKTQTFGQPAVKSKINLYTIIAFICGGLSVFNVFPLLLGIVSVVLAKSVLKNIKTGKEPETSKKLSNIALITGYVGLGLVFIRMIYFLSLGYGFHFIFYYYFLQYFNF